MIANLELDDVFNASLKGAEMNERYSGLVNNFNTYAYHFLGCGAIGSAAAVTMAKMGANIIHLYDMDIAKSPNIGVSIYDRNDLNKQK